MATARLSGGGVSPDSAHYSYLLERVRGVAIVVDGEIEATHRKAQGIAILSDGSLEYLASDEDERLYRFRVTGF